MSRTFTPTPGYRLFLSKLVQTREDRGYSIEQLAELIGLTPAQVASFESGAVPLGFIDVRIWLLALDMPFVQFTQQMEEVLDSTLERDETITFPDDPEDAPAPHRSPLPNPQLSRPSRCFSSRPAPRPKCAPSRTRSKPSRRWSRG